MSSQRLERLAAISKLTSATYQATLERATALGIEPTSPDAPYPTLQPGPKSVPRGGSATPREVTVKSNPARPARPASARAFIEPRPTAKSAAMAKAAAARSAPPPPPPPPPSSSPPASVSPPRPTAPKRIWDVGKSPAKNPSKGAATDQKTLAKLMLAKKLAERPGVQELQDKNILKGSPAKGISPALMSSATELEKRRARDALAHSLEARPSADELQARNVLKAAPGATISPVLLVAKSKLEKERTRDALGRSLEMRPAAADLQEKGILVGGGPGRASARVTEAQAKIEKRQRRNSLEMALEQRETLEELAARGIYREPEPAKRPYPNPPGQVRR